MNSYSAPRARLRVVKSARDPPNPLQPFPVPFRPPASACGARFFSFFTANTSKKSPEKALPPQRWPSVDTPWTAGTSSNMDAASAELDEAGLRQTEIDHGNAQAAWLPLVHHARRPTPAGSFRPLNDQGDCLQSILPPKVEAAMWPACVTNCAAARVHDRAQGSGLGGSSGGGRGWRR